MRNYPYRVEKLGTFVLSSLIFSLVSEMGKMWDDPLFNFPKKYPIQFPLSNNLSIVFKYQPKSVLTLCMSVILFEQYS